VEGHCCPYCGGRVYTKQQLTLMTVQIVADEALEGYAEKVAWHTRRAWDGGVEILIKEKGDYSGITTEEAVENLREMLQSWGAYLIFSNFRRIFKRATQKINLLVSQAGIR